MRVFLALPMPDAVRDGLVALQGRIKAGRKVAPEHLHMTLVFAGEVPEAQLAELDDQLQDLTVPALPIRLRGLSVMGGGRVLSIQQRADTGLIGFQARLERRVRDAGIRLQKRRFQPHVTIARWREGDVAALEGAGRALERFGDVEMPGGTMDRVAMYRSELRPEGAVYHELACYPDLPPWAVGPGAP
ncbi:RNA 2',3'-cyclic phosphodiesterase [Poseidonocella sedimentorum]|uniref:RNA 2',3'-cyclic phosphodiesterase n=1 Tax=Poseidonocella sedimentorum TaxID=871652 RepID=A0A1I6E7K3_9RHOB|nr:RNA 2',3'-cyclic phosphodiesterase [Poseidonocella sedimentorum]SFR13715.1 2'-5' RNA ligase [Poseidonocella sedimentorum]